MLNNCSVNFIRKDVKIIILAEKIIAYIKSEADKEVSRKAKAKEQDIRGYVIDTLFKKQKKRRKYIGK